MPVGTQCKVVQTDAGGADATTVAVDEGAAAQSRAAVATVRASGTTVAFTNTFDVAPQPGPGPDPDPDPDPDPRPLPDPDPRPLRDSDPQPEPIPPTLPATGTDVMMQLLISLAALLLGGSLVRVTRPRRKGWLRA